MDEGNGRKIFHDMVEWLVEHEYEKWVHPPVEEIEIRCAEAKFAAMGFPGCITRALMARTGHGAVHLQVEVSCTLVRRGIPPLSST
jgi:hypothetical protein